MPDSLFNSLETTEICGPTGSMTWKERILLLLLAALNFTHILDFMVMMPLGNYLMPHFGISTQQFSFLVTAYSASAAVSGFTAAFFVDRYDRKKVLLLGYTGFIIGTWACGFAPGYLWLLAARLVAGSFGGLISAQILSMVSDLFGYERRARAMGAVMSAFAVASTVGIPFALYLANLFTWHAPFYLVGGMGLLILPLIAIYLPPMTMHLHAAQVPTDKWKILTTVWNSSRQRNALLFSGLIIMGHFLIIPFINPYMEFNNGYSRSMTPLIYLVGGIASFVSAYVLGYLADKKGKLRVFTVCVLLSLILVFSITHIDHYPFAWVLVLFGCWFVLSTGRGVTGQAMISNVVPPEQRGGFMSFNGSVQQLGTTAAALLAGFVVNRGADGKIHHYEWLGYLSIVVLLACVALARKIFS